MLQELFRIPGLDIPIYGYGFMLVVGFLFATQLAKFLARRSRIDPEIFVNAGLIALVSGVVGARLSHVLENWPDYSRHDLSFFQNLFNAINIRSGGLTFYGGLILGFVCTASYAYYKRLPFRIGMDIVAPAIMIGLGFGRVGCFLNGCCYGAEYQGPLAVTFPYYSNAYQDQVDHGEIIPPAALTVPLQNGGTRLMTPAEARKAGLWALAQQQHAKPLNPAQLFSSFDAFLIAALLVAFYTIPHAPGRGFALMLLLMGPARFLLEMVRAEPPITWVGNYGLSFSMVMSIFFVIAGTILWVVFGWMARENEWQDQMGGQLLPA